MHAQLIEDLEKLREMHQRMTGVRETCGVLPAQQAMAAQEESTRQEKEKTDLERAGEVSVCVCEWLWCS